MPDRWVYGDPCGYAYRLSDGRTANGPAEALAIAQANSRISGRLRWLRWLRPRKRRKR
jgi:hypothetical protein